MQPDEATGETPYTLNQGLQDMSRAMSCSTQTYDCTYVGSGMQSCRWVTKSICKGEWRAILIDPFSPV
ncbi:hypothetical protein GCM10009069_23780 [Algimonas arctica]|uniref:Uncharacterized protein n=1 Tax=Algimonas arctica TaxID=1479486 RepID=A0A8J3G308_9PROT|nr:hypothetical protein [Algimonas arctica]GHB00196.1 hypothetical protein GCM10009069_23780 [Algimonas arctica]